jgi:[glutamine synthetase] adenylyltransferase / [glutamine synthetase]-adenylyl-L-tyrosine phosphorylase
MDPRTKSEDDMREQCMDALDCPQDQLQQAPGLQLTNRALHTRISAAPFVYDGERATGLLADLTRRCGEEPELAALGPLIAEPPVRDLLAGIFGASPYLTGLIERNPASLLGALSTSPEMRFAALTRDLAAAVAAASTAGEAMRALRLFKADIALLTALCDLAGVWPVMAVTRHLSQAADAAVTAAVGFLFRQAARAGDWLADDPAGYIVLGMGKYGAFELNYSSDIDLIVFYDTARIRLRAGLEAQPFFVRITRDLVRLLSERTGDGYVFRTDLRLRPDPGATPLAISTSSALAYYESVGQNWERAALIKARVCAGDIAAGEAFIGALSPFIWRKYLDFAAVADIHAMKQQIHAYRGHGEIAIEGHNVKLGRGGIREIEFFIQTQQLIAGGRHPELRMRETLASLAALAAGGWIDEAARDDLAAAYRFLRVVEHRLQMVRASNASHASLGSPIAMHSPRRSCRTCAMCSVTTPRCSRTLPLPTPVNRAWPFLPTATTARPSTGLPALASATRAKSLPWCGAGWPEIRGR